MHWIKFACDLTGCQWMTLWLCVLIQIPISVCWNETLSSLFSTTYHFNVTDKILLLTTVSSFIPFPLSRCRSVSDSLLPCTTDIIVKDTAKRAWLSAKSWQHMLDARRSLDSFSIYLLLPRFLISAFVRKLLLIKFAMLTVARDQHTLRHSYVIRDHVAVCKDTTSASATRLPNYCHFDATAKEQWGGKASNNVVFTLTAP